MTSLLPAQKLSVRTETPFAYSVCTLVNNLTEYRQMLDSFMGAGFGASDCEYLYIDNSQGNQADGYAGCNHFLRTARGRYIILCHQDILLQHHRREDLEQRIAGLDARDPRWGLLGNAGGARVGIVAGRVVHPDYTFESPVPLPYPVLSLDENFILVKKEANLVVSGDLHGWHFYGTDICIIGRMLGWSAWVVDFELLHKSAGLRNESFYKLKQDFVRKYNPLLRGQFVQTMCSQLPLAGTLLQRWFWAQWDRHLRFECVYHARKRARRGIPLRPGELLPAIHPVGYVLHWMIHRVRRPLDNLRGWLRKRGYLGRSRAQKPSPRL